jgi:hypothetical protein
MSSCSVAQHISAIENPVGSLRVIALLIGLCVTSAAQAATITVHPEDNYGRIFVDIAGDITLADIKTFSDNIARLPSEKVYVSLSSEGGSAVAAEKSGFRVAGNHFVKLSGRDRAAGHRRAVWPNWGSRRSSAIV